MNFKRIKGSLYMVRNGSGLKDAAKDFSSHRGTLLNTPDRLPGLVFFSEEGNCVKCTGLSFEELKDVIRDYD